MVYDDESESRRAVIESVESRWERKEAIRKRIVAENRKTRLRMIFATVAVLVFIAFGIIFALPRLGIDMPDAGCLRSIWESLKPNSGDDYVVDVDKLSSYAGVFAEFKTGRASRWRDAPDEIKPKSAVAGTVWHALVLDETQAFDIYEMTAVSSGRVSVKLLSPVAQPTSVTMGFFKTNCVGRSCFIAHGGVIYACGGLNAEAVEKLLPRVRAEMTPPRSK